MLERLTVEEKVGQLFLAGFDGAAAAGARAALADLRIGNVVLLANAGSADEAKALTAGLQGLARDAELPPLLIAVDHEGGPVQRIRRGASALGSNWDLGQVRPIDGAVAAACSRGAIHGRELAEMGINLNLAPVLDVWDNPRNTVIGERSYGRDPDLVARLGTAYLTALQAKGVLAVGKHFPGHGSTVEDSHLTLPVLDHDRARLDAVELVPFRAAIRAGVAGIMTAHVSYPLVDPGPTRPASLSPVIVTDLLRRELGFDGLIVTDDLGQMRAITDQFEPGEAAIRAILAGSDLLIVAGPLAREQRMVEALRAEIGQRISNPRLDESVRRVLRAKQQAGLLSGGTNPALALEPCASAASLSG